MQSDHDKREGQQHSYLFISISDRFFTKSLPIVYGPIGRGAYPNCRHKDGKNRRDLGAVCLGKVWTWFQYRSLERLTILTDGVSTKGLSTRIRA